VSAASVNPNVVRLPADIPAEIRKLVVDANPGAVFADAAISLPPGAIAAANVAGVQTPTVHGGILSTVLKIVRAAADTGLSIFLPGVLGSAIDAAVDEGVDTVIARIDSSSVEERWTLDRIAAARASVAEPTT